MTQRTPTLRAVAAAAGVSITIVSRVVNGRSDGMTPATRARVEAAIAELGYRPNRAGRSLRTRRHYRVALLAFDTSPEFLADPFNTYIVAGLSNALSDAGYGLLVQRLDPRRPSDALLERAQESDALAIYLSGPKQARGRLLARCCRLGLPVVLFQEPLQRPPPDLCTVRQADRDGAAWLGERLRTRAMRDVLVLLPSLAWPAAEERLAGLRTALGRSARIETMAADETDPDAVLSALETRLSAGLPDAIIGNNDQFAAQAIRALRRLGREVPRDLAVAGYNAFPVTGVVEPALTTVRSAAYRLGTEGARLVLERLDLGQFSTTDLVLPVEPVPGETL